MKSSHYGERDYAFGQRMLTLRTTLGLTQKGLAELLGVTRRAVTDWEAGSSYPKVEHLKSFIGLCVKLQAFSFEHEVQEIRALWKSAHQKVLLDEQWLAAILYGEQRELPDGSPASAVSHPVPRPHVDWGDAPTIPTFYGREQELALLTQWIVQEHCRVVSVLGMGGMGKSALVVNLMQQMTEHFDVVLFRSLRNVPSCEALIADCLQVLSPQLLREVPDSPGQRIDLLIDQLRRTRALLVLDNLETILEERETKGRFLHGFEGYGTLLQRIAGTEQRSCVLLTSREKPAVLRALEGNFSPVRSLRLSGLDSAACEQILAEKGAVGLSQDRVRLIEMYAGNPLALRIVTETIADLFGGEIGQFLAEGMTVFGSISDLLAEQFARLSPVEQKVLRWLTIAREPVTIEELLTMLVIPLPRVQVFEAIDSLSRRSFIERGKRMGSFTSQSVVLEYGTETLIAEIVSEIQQQQPGCLIEYGLEQAGAREHVRQTQRRMLIAPILAQLYNTFQGRSKVAEQIFSLLHQLRGRAGDAQGYGPANLIALLRELRGNLRKLDLSHLTIRGADLQGVEMQDSSLVSATLCGTIFTEAQDAFWSLAISSRGTIWAAGSRRGNVRVWKERGEILHLIWQAHSDTVSTLAFSPDEYALATGSSDGTVKLWDLEHGTLCWSGWHTHGVNSVAFSSDGSLLASGGDDGTIRFWDVRSGRNIHTLTVQGNTVHPARWNPDSQLPSSGCVGGNIRLWQMQGTPPATCSVRWSPDSQLLASGCVDGNIRLWQMQGTSPATCARILAGHTSWVTSLAFAPDGKTMASASWDHTVKLWEAESGHALETLTGHTDRVYRVAWSPDGHTVASAGFDKAILLWDVEKGRYRAVLYGHTSVVYSIAFSPDSHSLLSSSEDGTLRVWDTESGECGRIIKGYKLSFYDLAWSPDGRWLASADSDRLVVIWDAEQKTRPRALRGHKWTILGVAWSPDGQLLASAGRDNAIRLWDPNRGVCLQVLRGPNHTNSLFQNVAWSPDGRLLASGSFIQGVQVWAMDTCIRCWVGSQQQTRIRRVAWSPDSTRLASCGDDGSICLWEASNGSLLGRLQDPCGSVMDVAWSPDGRWLASGGGGNDGEVLIWDVKSGDIVFAFPDHGGRVFAVVWSPSGKVVISGNSEGSIRWWDVQRKECLATRKGHQGAVWVLRMNPGERTLASGGDDSAIQLWDVENAELLQTLRQDRPYERLNITGARGLTETQQSTLRILGAIEE